MRLLRLGSRDVDVGGAEDARSRLDLIRERTRLAMGSSGTGSCSLWTLERRLLRDGPSSCVRGTEKMVEVERSP